MKFSLGGANSERQQPSSSSKGHQAQHGAVRYLGTKVGKNGTHMGGNTKSGQTEGKKDKVGFTHASKRLLETVGVSEKFNIVQVNL